MFGIAISIALAMPGSSRAETTAVVAESAQTWCADSPKADRFDLPTAVAALAGDLDPSLVLAVIRVESNFNSRAVSPRGAMGLMQLMPATARALGVTNPFDPFENIRGGIAYLRAQIRRFGRIDLALAAYNAGPGAVERHGGVPPYRETREYVRRVLAAWERCADAGERGPLTVSRSPVTSEGSTPVVRVSPSRDAELAFAGAAALLWSDTP